MTDKIGIDEQIARIKRRVELERELEQLEIGDLPIYLAVLETLRDYKRIMELLRESYEVYAGMEGTPIPQTACEAYLMRIIMEMQKPLSAAILAEVEKDK